MGPLRHIMKNMSETTKSHGVVVHTYVGAKFTALQEAEIAAVRDFVRKHSDLPRETLEEAINRLPLTVRPRRRGLRSFLRKSSKRGLPKPFVGPIMKT